MMERLFLTAAACLVFQMAQADFQVTCSKGCVDIPDRDRTLNLLLIEDSASAITLTWQKTTAPAERTDYRLYAGNPAQTDALSDLGALDFAAADSGWSASREFSLERLGRGSFIAALIAERRGDESIAYWQAFRLQRLSQSLADAEGVPFSGNLSLEIIPEFIQVSSGHGELPKHVGGNDKVWWQIPASVVPLSVTVDMDGDRTGVPPLTITHSAIWQSEGNDWKQSLQEKLQGVAGHFIDFDELEFSQSADRSVDVGGETGTVHLKHYYGAITLFTTARTRDFSAQDLGKSGSRKYFSHETTADLNQADEDPRLWSSYSRREYSADPRLLRLIAKSQKRSGSVPGLGFVQTADGDGGGATYSVAFKVRVSPWSVPASSATFKAGFVHIDVVASRTGFGSVDTRNELEGSGLCKLIPCLPGETTINLNSPPDGYVVAHPVAVHGSQSGTATIFTEQPLVAARNFDPSEPGLDFPRVARFGLASHLRAGALIQEKRGLFSRRPLQVVPINSYAQYVLKYTVAMVPNTVIVASDESIIPDLDEFDTIAPVPPPPKGWLQGLIDSLGAPLVGLLALVVLIVLAPSVLVLLRSLTKLLVAIIDSISAMVRPKPDA